MGAGGFSGGCVRCICEEVDWIGFGGYRYFVCGMREGSMGGVASKIHMVRLVSGLEGGMGWDDCVV